MELVKQNRNQSSLTIETAALGKIIYQVNQLSPFTIPDDRIIEWSESLLEILPNIEVEDLRSLLIDFKTNEINYDTKLGIQNIFIGLKLKFGNKYFNVKHVF